MGLNSWRHCFSALTMTGNKIDVCLISFMIHSPTRQRNCTPVNMWTRNRGTLRKYGRSGWYFLGMKSNSIRSKNCRPFSDATPMNRNTPYKTGIGIIFNTGTIKTESPTSVKMMTWVTRCSLEKKNYLLTQISYFGIKKSNTVNLI